MFKRLYTWGESVSHTLHLRREFITFSLYNYNGADERINIVRGKSQSYARLRNGKGEAEALLRLWKSHSARGFGIEIG